MLASWEAKWLDPLGFRLRPTFGCSIYDRTIVKISEAGQQGIAGTFQPRGDWSGKASCIRNSDGKQGDARIWGAYSIR